MAVDDDILNKTPFGLQLAGVVVNDSVTREAISREDMRRFLNSYMLITATASITMRKTQERFSVMG